MNSLPWLPPLFLLQEHGGNWEEFDKSVYRSFQNDFCAAPFGFMGKRVGLKRYPISSGREATFWHLTSSGLVEADRMPDIRRYERIAWPKAVMLNHARDEILVWSEDRRGEDRIHLYHSAERYLVILADRGEYILPWTAYCIERSHQHEKLMKRWQDNR